MRLIPAASRKAKKRFFFSFFYSSGSFGFLFFFFCSCHSLSVSRLATTTSFLLACLTGHHLPPNLALTCPMFSCPPHLACACCALSFSPKTFSSPCTHSFLVHTRHCNWCWKGSGRVYCAVFLRTGPPQSPLPTGTTTSLTHLSFVVYVQLCLRYPWTPSFWVKA